VSLRILGKIKSEPWAITQAYMDTIMDVAERQNLSPDAVAQKMGRPLENTYDVEYRDGVAILPVTGPLFRYANLFTALSGATSYDLLARDFAKAVDDPRVEAIILNIDSPGGEANGVSEFADQIAAARGKKPIVAYVGGLGASAAYWLAAAADEVVVADTAMLGSIGTVMTVRDSREKEAKAGEKTYEIVSSQSPHKRLDPATDEGRARMQALVDSLSDVFVDKVASYRGTDRDTVLKNYGQGDVLVGQAAVAAGLADRVGSFEGVLSELASGRYAGPVKSGAAASVRNGDLNMAEPKFKKSQRVRALADHMRGMKGMTGSVAMVENGPYYAVNFDEPMEGGKNPHKWFAENEIELVDEESDSMDMSAKTAGSGANQEESKVDPTKDKLTAAQVVKQHPEAAHALRAEGVKTERDRIKAILSSAEAEGRGELAQAMAFEGDMSPEAAVALLAKSPKAAKQPANPLAAAMAGEKNPQVGADADTTGEKDPVAFIAAAAKKAGI